MKKLSVLLFALLFVFSCDDESIIEQPNSDELFTVSGKVTIDNVPVESSTVALNKIDSEANYSVQTDSEGDFSLEVLEGSYRVVVSKTFSNGSFLYYSYQATVNQDVNMENIEMPEPVTLSCASVASVSGFTLNWPQSTSSEFLEYRLYTNDTSTIDENTGTLIYTGTSITDTSFFVSENLVPLQTYYYRVFVVDTNGEIAGSNVIQVTVEEDAVSLYSVSGNVLVGSSLTDGVQIQLDRITDNTSYSSTTNTSGEFQMNNVEEGDYELTVQKTFDNGAFSSNVLNPSISQSIYYEGITLSEPINLSEPSFIAGDLVRLNWSQATTNDFQEYRIYIGSTPNVDETTGTLVHTETSISNTEFDVTGLTPLQTYFFRVYARNSTNVISGSNTIEVITENTNLIQNGSFEENGTAPPTSWGYLPSIGALVTGTGEDISISTTEAFDGNQSVRYNPPPAPNTARENNVTQAVPAQNLTPNGTYRMSFQLKVNNMSANNQPHILYMSFLSTQQSGGGNYTISDFSIDDDSWIYHEYEFTMPSVITSDFNLLMELHSGGTTDFIGFWIDDVILIRID